MGLYIPGTSIRGCGVGGPIGCGCPCYNPYNGRCQVVDIDVGDPTVLGFPDFCSIVHVQSPHDRLIDADEFLKNAQLQRCFRGDYALLLNDVIEECATIIPAEEG